jgi:hypothetical protein
MLAFRRLFRPHSAAQPAQRVRPCLEGLEERAVPSSTSIISSNFNGTAIPAGDSVWFNSVVKVSGVGPSGATLHLSNAEVDFTSKTGTPYQLSLPNAALTFSPSATQATTSFDPSTNTWDTTVPVGLGGNTFLSGVGLYLPNGLPGGTNPVNWKGTFTSDASGLSVNWQWAAAVYTQFSSDPSSLNVKPVDSNQASVYQNSDHAGTPEAYKAYVTGGARGGGGSNWTGSYSATATVFPGPYVPPTSSLAGSVVDTLGNPLSGAVVTLKTTDSLGNVVTVGSVTTDSSGTFSFSGLAAGNYTLTETPPPNFVDVSNVLGTGTTGGTSNTSTNSVNFTLGAGVNSSGFVFTDQFHQVLGGS